MTPTKKPKPAAPFKIDGPGLYLTRDGRTVEVERNTTRWADQYPWRKTGSYGDERDQGHDCAIAASGSLSALGTAIDEGDIIAKAPSAPKPRPAKGKKAKRRYRVEPSNDRTQYIVRRLKDRWIMAVCDNRRVARILAHALNGAAMKEAQRGGASTTSMRKSSK